MNKVKQILLLIFFCLIPIHSFSEVFVDYGWEDWGGTVASTTDYLYNSTYTSFCAVHEDCSEVVTSYNGLSAHSGSYFWIRQGHTAALDPAVSGISGCTGDTAYAQMGVGSGSECGSTDFVCNTASETYYFEQWIAMPAWPTAATGPKYKFFWFDSAAYGSPYWTIAAEIGTGYPLLYASSVNPATGDGQTDYTIGPGDTAVTLEDEMDGTWHKFAWWIDWQSTNPTVPEVGGTRTAVYIYMWIDEDNPTLATSGDHPRTGNWDGYVLESIDPAFTCDAWWGSGNWSGDDGYSLEWWVAIDDIYISDSLPTETITEAPTSQIGSGVPVNIISGSPVIIY